ncbi:alpha/beta fold hydrolase [Actinomadura madurae]|uniref:alpha/beta fold hydrolase n=1 Tax=Actinomadura madurae TaxID=1993 RepID=UPI000D9E0CDC|nr:alpha/beta fold hydrolase [Actinomadura madurae]SPT51255.1 Tripeptidyl aminopeptidase precursor [Actinomadura madurae]
MRLAVSRRAIVALAADRLHSENASAAAIRKAGLGTVCASALLMAGLPLAPAKAAGQLSWRPCAKAARDWPVADDTSTECAMLTVPMDYANPQGRKIKIAVSRIRAADPGKRRGALLVSPGGPGIFNLDGPPSLVSKGLGALATDHDIIGLDPRGVGHSDKINCAETPAEEQPEASAKERAKAFFDAQAKDNERCVATDPAFIRQLTTRNIARDVDAIRAALGESKISFFGVSYGTAVGANYRSMFDDRVDRMWLDSVMPTVMDSDAMNASLDELRERNFAGFVSWMAAHDPEYHFGTTAGRVRKSIFDLRDRLKREPVKVDDETVLDGEWVTVRLGGGPRSWPQSAKDLATVREGGIPESARSTGLSVNRQARVFGLDDPVGGLNTVQYNAVMCNEGTGGRDFEKMWARKEARMRAYPATGGVLQFGIYCAGWPWPAQEWEPVKGNSPLQLSGHIGEFSTPYAWAVAMRDAIGGVLLTIEDDEHGSLSRIPCAARAVDFFRTGRTTGGTCPGVR